VADSFAWTPDIPATAAYQVYARWTAGPDRASNAKYLIEHSGGTAEVEVSQRQGGGIWNLLGTFTLPSGTGNRIILTDDGANGTLVADAIRITREVDGGNIAHVHTDQLGQPQKLTDASKAVVWDRVARPFGATAAETGTTAVALRFPGQWADAESGYHYNYFRDYDPSIGRYLQSDPIGLKGGRNRYAYADLNSLNFVDPSGLQRRGGRPPAGEPNGGTPGSQLRQLDLDLHANRLEQQIRRYDPNYTREGLSSRNSPGATEAEIRYLEQLLASHQGQGPAAGRSCPRPFNADQQALIELAKIARRTGLSEPDARTLLEWAREYNILPAQNHIGTDHWAGGDHIRVGPVNHIPVK
jgi:RHS repeat-associated protein